VLKFNRRLEEKKKRKRSETRRFLPVINIKFVNFLMLEKLELLKISLVVLLGFGSIGYFAWTVVTIP